MKEIEKNHLEKAMLTNYLTVKQVAELLHIKPSTCKDRIRRGLIPVVRFGSGAPLINETQLQKTLIRLGSVRSLQEPFDRTTARNASETEQLQELGRRAKKLQQAVGVEPILLILRT